MGAWGTEIHQNDTAEDIKDDYLGKLKAGKSDEEALSELLKEYQSAIRDEDEIYDIYFSLADVMWKNGRLTEEIKQETLKLIEKESQSERWESEALKKSREKVLCDFKEKLCSEMPARKKISIHKPYVTGWEEGDVYYFQINKKVTGSEEYLGWYVLIYVDKINKKDWQVKGVYDEIPEVYLFIQKKKPEVASDLTTADSVCLLVDKKWGGQYRAKLIEDSRRLRPKDLAFLGKYDKFIAPNRDFPKEMMGTFGWRNVERSVLWGYKRKKNICEMAKV